MFAAIDFLPASYREKRLRQRQRVWRRSALGVLLLLIVAGALGQRQTRANLNQTREKLHAHAGRMAAQVGDPDKLKQEITKLDEEANLLAMLRLRVPSTRILAAVANALPQYVTLTEFHLQFEALPPPNRGQAPLPAAAPAPPDTAVKKSLELLDLESLRKTAEETGLYVVLQGIAPDDIVIAGYLATLQQTGVFAEVSLQNIDQELVNRAEMRRFKARLRVKPPQADNATNQSQKKP